jgi:hypothetical protein
MGATQTSPIILASTSSYPKQLNSAAQTVECLKRYLKACVAVMRWKTSGALEGGLSDRVEFTELAIKPGCLRLTAKRP